MSQTQPLAVAAVVRELHDVARKIVSGGTDRARLQRDAVLAFGVRVASAGILYLSQIVMARWMGGFEYGIFVSVWTWVLVLGGFSHLGLNMGVIRLLPSYKEAGRLDLHRGLMRGSRMLAFGVGTLIALAALAGLHFLGNRIEGTYALPLYIALACVPMYAVTDVQDGIGRGKAWISLALLPPYVMRPLLLLIVMIVAHEYGLPMEARTAAAAAIVATWATAIVQLLLINRRAAADMPAGPRSYDFCGWLETSLPLLVIGACEIVIQTADVLIVSRYLSPNEVGIYFAAAKTMSLVMFVHYAVGSAAANRFATLHARGDREALQPLVADAVRWTFWPSLAAAAVLLALGWPLLRLFGPTFTSGYPVMFILVLGFLFRAAMGPSEFLLNMMGQQKMCAAVLAVTAALNVSLNFALVPRFGLVGAATATALALMFAAIMNNLVAYQRLGIKLSILSNLGRASKS
ncbi:MAG: lipopolysaccharide biosynthesis protein [Hyphomicrobiaceae bacterium]